MCENTVMCFWSAHAEVCAACDTYTQRAPAREEEEDTHFWTLNGETRDGSGKGCK